MTALDFPTSPSNGDTYENYVYDSTDGVWKRIAAGIELNGISDVTLSSPTTDQLLRWNGTEWVNGTANTDSIADDAITAAKLADTAGAVMVFADDTARGSAIPSPTEGMVTYRSDDDAVEVYDGSSWNAVGPGQILQVVSTTKTDTFSASVAQGAQSAVTGLSATITPTSTSSKILVFFDMACAGDQATIADGLYATLYRGGSATGYIGDAVGSRQRTSSGTYMDADSATTNISGHYLDSPASTSSLTYQIYISHWRNGSAATVFVNRTDDDTDGNFTGRSASTITLMEVAG